MLALSPVFDILVVGLAAPLVILLSENSWPNGALLSTKRSRSPTLKHSPVNLSHTTSLLLKSSPLLPKKNGTWAIAAGAMANIAIAAMTTKAKKPDLFRLNELLVLFMDFPSGKRQH